MSDKDGSFIADEGLEHAVRLLRDISRNEETLPEGFPASGIGETETLDLLAIL